MRVIYIRKNKKLDYRNYIADGIFLAFLIILVILGVSNYIKTEPKVSDLLTNQDWSHFAGADLVSSGVRIKPLNRVITHHDMSAGQPNPPINIRGPHLHVTGDFQVDAKLTGIDNGASLDLYSQVPIIFDEWRQERGRVEIDVTNNLLRLRLWDGSSSTENDTRSFRITLKNSAALTIIHRGDKLIIKADRHTLGYIPDHNIFASQSVWFGADANPGSEGWTLNSLKAKALGDGQAEVISAAPLDTARDDSEALRNLAERHPRSFKVGAALSLYPLFSDEQYRKIALGQFNMLTPENSLKAETIHPQKDVYSFEEGDSFIQLAFANQMQVHGHALVSDKSNPTWINTSKKEARRQILVDHISRVVGHYRGRVAEWDVVNEPLSEENIDYTNGNLGLRWDLWYEAMGDTYINTALKTARAADPAAKLFINDYGLESAGQRWDAMISLIQRLQQSGTPIDGVGFEAHVYHAKNKIDPEILRSHIQQLAAMGIVSRISEIDVLGDDPNFQAEQYADILKICLAEPACTSYTTWGIADQYGSTILSDRYPPVLGDSLIWDEKMMPKPAYASLQNILQNE